MNISEVQKQIHESSLKHAQTYGQLPTGIRLRKDVDAELHASPHAFLYDFIDLNMTRERFMGMDVTVVEDGPEFELEGSSEGELV